MENKEFLLKKEKNNAGFTLLEITIVIVIITVLFSIFLVNYRGAEKEFALSRSAHKLAQDIRRVQEMAIASQITPPDFEAAESVFPEGGYGIYIKVTPLETEKTGRYIIFADCDDDDKYDESGSVSCEAAGDGNSSPEKITEVFLEEGIYISKVGVLPYAVIDTVEITFFPPDPEITINGVSDKDEAYIYLTFEEDGPKKRVSINKAGLIEITSP